jgi:hypothetical protein
MLTSQVKTIGRCAFCKIALSAIPSARAHLVLYHKIPERGLTDRIVRAHLLPPAVRLTTVAKRGEGRNFDSAGLMELIGCGVRRSSSVA